MTLKVEGTLDELMELFGDARSAVRSAKKSVRSAKKVVSKVKRPLNSWQKYLKTNKNKFRYKSGKRKGQIDFAKASRAFKKTPAGKKVKR
jgi:polyhydroxyalkanoate synthesis regulator protein